MARAMFAAPADAAAGCPALSVSAASASAPTTNTSADDGGKHPWTTAPRHHQVPSHANHIPPALRIARENATARMMGPNATPQGYYHPSEKQKKFKWKPGTRSFERNPVLPEIYCFVIEMLTVLMFNWGSCSRLQD